MVLNRGVEMEMLFAHAAVRMPDIDLFFQGFHPSHPFMQHSAYRHMLAGDVVWSSFQPSETMAHLVHRAGLFKSVGEARRNGWARPVPAGFTDLVIGKRKVKIFILNFVDEN